MRISMVRCWKCKGMYAHKHLIIYTVRCSDGKNHFLCWNCKAENTLAYMRGTQA